MSLFQVWALGKPRAEGFLSSFFARMRKISEISMSTTMFGGLESSLPIFIAPAALARLGHPDGEMNLVRAAGSEGILQGVSAQMAIQRKLVNPAYSFREFGRKN